MATLGVNIDHIATLREARKGVEPEPVYAASIAEQNGADQITVHLREDRRHIQLRDVRLLRQVIQTKLNLEMAATEEMIAIAESIKPDTVTLVPEKREELTTEGGLKLTEHHRGVIERLKKSGIEVSVFIEADPKMIKTAIKYEADAVEIHTGTYANLKDPDKIENELQRIERAVKTLATNKLRIAAGHGLNYFNIKQLRAIEGIEEYNIGHSIISRAVFSGLAEAVYSMKLLVE
ncbi:MAG: pyridoxine 5'-phosphate synthase [Candidatus Cloacimonadota bacterium]|nr:pyridoxine 5'-phosphate synthase [Candidatus Cloacimonadota bacterium]